MTIIGVGYIFFVLIPILYLLSGLSLDFKNTNKKYIFIFILVAPSFFNHFTENTFKQFYKGIYPSKPEVGKSLEYMVKNNNLNYSFVSVKNNPQNINFVYEKLPTNFTTTPLTPLSRINVLEPAPIT